MAEDGLHGRLFVQLRQGAENEDANFECYCRPHIMTVNCIHPLRWKRCYCFLHDILVLQPGYLPWKWYGWTTKCRVWVISLTLERIISRVSGEAMSAVRQHLISTSPPSNKNPSSLRGWKMASGVSYRAHDTFLIHFYRFPFNIQPDTLIIQIYSVIKLYMFRAYSLPIIRCFILYIQHW